MNDAYSWSQTTNCGHHNHECITVLFCSSCFCLFLCFLLCLFFSCFGFFRLFFLLSTVFLFVLLSVLAFLPLFVFRSSFLCFFFSACDPTLSLSLILRLVHLGLLLLFLNAMLLRESSLVQTSTRYDLQHFFVCNQCARQFFLIVNIVDGYDHVYNLPS